MGMKCRRCGKGIKSDKGQPPRYCETCLHVVEAEKRKKAEEARKVKLGTTNISSKISRKENGEPDFDKEKNILDKELRDLGLK